MCGSRMGSVVVLSLLVLGTLPMQRGLGAEGGAPSSFLRTLAETEGGVTIVYGTRAASREAAHVLRDAIRRLPGQGNWDNLLSAEQFDEQSYQKTGPTHVIAVGTLWDNVALRGRDWLPTWWLDRDWYYQEYDFALTPEQIGLPYQRKSGFMAAGYGQWPKGESRIGYVEVDRSPYFMEWMVRSRLDRLVPKEKRSGDGFYEAVTKLKEIKSPTYPHDFPLRLLVRITGSGDEGVLAAARAFAERGLLGGAVLADGAKADDGPTMFTLPQERYADRLPSKPPAGAEGYTYLGWLLPSAFQYDGFVFESGVRPRMMYRLKYKPPFGITNFWTTPHRRAGQFEICIVVFDSPDEAAKAEKGLIESLEGREAFKAGRITGFHTARRDHVLFTESLPEPAGKALLDACVGGWKGDRR